MVARNKSRAEIAYVSAGLTVSGLLLPVSFDASIIFAAAAAFFLGVIFKPERLKGWIPAFAVTFVWIAASGDMYSGYNTFNLSVFGISVFPVLAWPSGLIMGYYYGIPLIRISPWYVRWFALSVLYAFALVTLETIGYNVLGIKLDAGRGYPGWPVLNILHCPWWMQIAYFLNGIGFMGIVSWLDRDDIVGVTPVRAGNPV